MSKKYTNRENEVKTLLTKKDVFTVYLTFGLLFGIILALLGQPIRFIQNEHEYIGYPSGIRSRVEHYDKCAHPDHKLTPKQEPKL